MGIVFLIHPIEVKRIRARHQCLYVRIEKRFLLCRRLIGLALHLHLTVGFGFGGKKAFSWPNKGKAHAFGGCFGCRSQNNRRQEARAVLAWHLIAYSDRVLLHTTAFWPPILGGRGNPVVIDPGPTRKLVVPQATEMDRVLPPPLAVLRNSGTTDGFPMPSADMRQSLYQNKDALMPAWAGTFRWVRWRCGQQFRL